MTAITVLQRISESVRKRLAERKGRMPEGELKRLAHGGRPPQPFAEAFKGLKGARVIAEVKFASPSLGELLDPGVLSPADVAGEYLSNGAAAVSVLTEQDHFAGSLEYLKQVRAAWPEARLLMKDFVVEPYQLLEARAFGADAVLLIMALLGEKLTASLLGEAGRLGLDVLVEVHDERELAAASRAGARLVGINNRNLKNMEISLDASHRLARLARPGITLISESGISHGTQIRELTRAGYAGFLVGSSFMKTGAPGQALKRLLEEAR